MARKRSSETELAVSSAASSVPARRKPATATRTRKKPTTVPVEAVAEPLDAATPEVEVLEIATAHEPSREAVAALAYSYWVERGYQGGSPEQDWLRAEQELRNSRVATA